jgi:hypothetical protein
MTLFAHAEIETDSKIEIASEALAHKLTLALQFSSQESLNSLFPSLKEFHQLMDENKGFYGASLVDAKLDFAIEYRKTILPQISDSFDKIKEEGMKRGIDWKNIKPVRWESKPSNDGAVIFTLTLSSNGKEFQVLVEKALLIKDQLFVSQFVKLV